MHSRGLIRDFFCDEDHTFFLKMSYEYEYITSYHNIRQLKGIVAACQSRLESRIEDVHCRRRHNNTQEKKRVRNEDRNKKTERNDEKRQKRENKEEVSEDEPVSDIEKTETDIGIDTEDDEEVSQHSSDDEE